MKIFCKFPTVNILKLNFWLVICSAKNFIWTDLLIYQIPDFQIVCISAKYILSKQTIHHGKFIHFQMMYNLNFPKLALMTGFVVQGHI